MLSSSLLRRRPIVFLAAAFSTVLLSASAWSATLSWDITSGDGATITGGTGTWTNGAGNWNTGVGNTTWTNTPVNAAIFGGTAGTVTLGGAVTVGNISFNAGTGNYTIAGGANTLTLSSSTITTNTNATISATLGGTTGLIKAGGSTLTISGTNTYTGTTTISAGTLALKGSSIAAMSSYRSSTAISSGAVFNTDVTGRAGTYTGGDVGTGSTTSSLGNNTSFNISGAGTWRISGNSSDVLALGNASSKKVTVSMASGGLIDIAGGVLVNGGFQGGVWTSNLADMNIASGAKFDIWDGNAVSVDALTGSGTIGNGSNNNTDRSLTVGVDHGSGIFSGTIGTTLLGVNNAGLNHISLTKTGTGTQTLSGSNSYVGTTTVSGGVLEVTANNALGTIAAGTSVSSGAALKLTGVNYSTAEVLSLNGSGISNGGALVNSGNSTFAGTITAATNATINDGGGTLSLTGGLVKDGTTLTFTGGGSVILSGTGISGASASSDLVVDGTTLVVHAASNYNGPTTVQNSGTFVANAAVTTTQMNVSADSTLSGTGIITTGYNNYIYIDGTLNVGDSTLGAPVASHLSLATSGTGGTVLGAGSLLNFDLFQRGGDLTGTVSAADYLSLTGTLDATLGGTLMLVNANSLSGFAAGDMWRLFDLTGGGSISPGLALNYSALNLDPALVGNFNASTGIFSIDAAAVPEPSRALLLCCGLIGVMRRRRRASADSKQ